MALAAGLFGPAQAQQVISQDLVVQGSVCVGTDCVNGESFGFDTLRLKENNLRIHFQDTSNSASFPSTDWRLTANESTNGGRNLFSIDDATASRTIFVVEAGAPNNTMYLDDAGNLGMGTNAPVVEMHVADGDSPTLRLEQNGSSGFTPQTWDLAGNEANFFVRDVTNGSRLPFKIKPGAPTNALFVAADGRIGMGTDAPQDDMHIVDTSGEVVLRLDDGSVGDDVKLELDGDRFFVTFDGTGGAELTIRKTGEVEVGRGNLEVKNGNSLVVDAGGSIIVGGQALTVPDYVFAPDYPLMPLADVAAFIADNSHLPGVPSAAEVNGGALDLVGMQMTLLEKIEELTLYTLQQEARIAELEGRLERDAD